MTGNQSRRMSLVEALTNAAIGLAWGLAAQLIVFPAVGLQVRLDQNLAILAAFTVVSVVRNYLVRRVFNGPIHRFVLWLTAKVDQWLK